jgi:hypothetical protein
MEEDACGEVDGFFGVAAGFPEAHAVGRFPHSFCRIPGKAGTGFRAGFARSLPTGRFRNGRISSHLGNR